VAFDLFNDFVMIDRHGCNPPWDRAIGSSGHRAIENLPGPQMGSSSHLTLPITDTGKCVTGGLVAGAAILAVVEGASGAACGPLRGHFARHGSLRIAAIKNRRSSGDLRSPQSAGSPRPDALYREKRPASEPVEGSPVRESLEPDT
jgi:hypothetical protein